jgi:LysR family transcriptional regulator, cell division regulator
VCRRDVERAEHEFLDLRFRLASLPGDRRKFHVCLKKPGSRLNSASQEAYGYLSLDMGILTATPLEFGPMDAIIACVAAGIGITLLPRGVVSNAAEQGIVAIHKIASEKAHVETLFIRRHDAYVSSAMQAFIEIARSRHGALMVAA